MADSKYTPGPWRIGEYLIGQHAWEDRPDYDRAIYGHDQVKIAVMEQWYKDGGESEANARLIAAAPELLEACQAAFRLLNDPDADEFQAVAVTNALAAVLVRAQGEE